LGDLLAQGHVADPLGEEEEQAQDLEQGHDAQIAEG
jgi:hypothetical protein